MKFIFPLVLSAILSQAVLASHLEIERAQTVEDLFMHLNTGDKNIDLVDDIYAEDFIFVDPVVGEEGIRNKNDL